MTYHLEVQVFVDAATADDAYEYVRGLLDPTGLEFEILEDAVRVYPTG